MPTATAPLVGAHFRPPAKAILQHLPSGCPLAIVPEPDNQHDPNALAVFVASSSIPQDQHADLDAAAHFFGHSIEDILAQSAWQLGYVKATEAVVLQPQIMQVLAHSDDQNSLPATLAFDMKGLPTVSLELP